MSKIIGLDLGTTNSAFAYMVAGKPEVITNSEGDRTTPSVVAVTKKGDRLIGKVAQRQRVTNPKNTIYGIKRLIGRKFDDKEVQRDLDIMPYKIVKKGSGVAVELDGKDYTPEEIFGLFLNFQYDGSHLTCTTGTSLKTFTLDKSLDHAWDELVLKYFKQQQILWESV